MTPLIPLAAAGAGLWYWFGRKPQASDYQVTQVTGAGGVPIKVATPIPKAVTKPQATGISAVAPKPPAAASTITQAGNTYAPVGAVTQIGPGQVQIAPVVITPSGASSVAISAVLDVQRALNALGFTPPLTEDGKLGPLTIANIKAFQSRNNLAVDGNAGPATKAALSSALQSLAAGGSGAAAGAVASQAQSTGTLSTAPPVNMSSKDVQHSLNILGASPPLVEDGKIGPKSVAAIKSFQLAHGLVADGIAGPKTKVALAAAISGASTSVAGEVGDFGGTFSCGWS